MCPLPQTAVFGLQTRVTWFERMRPPSPSRAAMLSVLAADRPAGCGTVIPVVAVQWSVWVSGLPGTRTLVPAFTVSPSPLSAVSSAFAFAMSTGAVELSGPGLLREIDSTWIGSQPGRRASVTCVQTAVSKTHLPSVAPS